MTLAITEVSPLGVAMAADSALTFNGTRSFSGAQKLIPAQQIDAGFGIWGNFSLGNQYADEWLQDFISQHVQPGASLWSVAQELAKHLNQTHSGGVGDWMGIHVAGYDSKDGVHGPAFYHVHNGHAHVEFKGGTAQWVFEEDPPIREFRAECDCAPALVVESGTGRVTRNGDIAIHVLLSGALTGVFEDIGKLTSLRFPYPATLATRGEYLRFCIQTTAEVHRLSNFRPRTLTQAPTVGDSHIGGPITVLTISEDGIHDFYTK